MVWTDRSEHRLGAAVSLAVLLSVSGADVAATIEAATSYTEHKGLNCFHKHGGINIDSGPQPATFTVSQCKARCDSTPACFCTVMSENASATTAGVCWRRAFCDPEQCEESQKYNVYIKPGGKPLPPAPPPAASNCSKMAGSPLLTRGCIYDHAHNFHATDCGRLPCVAACCASCAAAPACTAWTHSAGFGRFACMLFNGSGTTGQLRNGPTKCTSAGSLPPPPPTPPAAPHLPAAGPPCKDCPNILLMFTDDQDLVLGGWEGPMVQTKKAIGDRGATATEWRIHTPICAPSRTEMQSGRYYHNIKNDAPTPFWSVTSGAIGHIALDKAWPQMFAKTLREQKGYTSALFGKCMNDDCGANPQAGGLNLHQMGAFDKWFEGTDYQNGEFYDNEAENCPGWPWPEKQCRTQVNESTVGAGYLTSELGNRTIQWIREAASERRPWFVYYATHAPHGPCTAAAWYKDACPGVGAPRQPNFNYSGHTKTSCSLYPPGSHSFLPGLGEGGNRWWNGTDFPELTSCQPGFTEAEAGQIDNWARRRCQSLLSVDDSYVQILEAVKELGQENNTYVLITSDHGYNLGNHMLYNAKMQFYDHSLRIPMLFRGPGIQHGSQLDFLGTQVDIAPTILGLAGIPTPDAMDGRSVVPLLVSQAAAEAQGDVIPASVLRHLEAAALKVLPARKASFHTYYNQGPWDVSQKWRLDDWSNTWLGLHYKADGHHYKYLPPGNESLYRRILKMTYLTVILTIFLIRALLSKSIAWIKSLIARSRYGEFDPFGKQSNFSTPYMYLLFDIDQDPYELENIYNQTKATTEGVALLAELHALLVRYNSCSGPTCP